MHYVLQDIGVTPAQYIHEGPGILLVGHQGNFSIDSADDRMGLLYEDPKERLTVRAWV